VRRPLDCRPGGPALGAAHRGQSSSVAARQRRVTDVTRDEAGDGIALRSVCASIALGRYATLVCERAQRCDSVNMGARCPRRERKTHDEHDQHQKQFHETLPSRVVSGGVREKTVTGLQQRQARGGTLILGGGFAGGYVARLLGKRGSTIVSLENFMLYTPILPEAASGTLEPRHVVVPLRMMCRHSQLVLGRAVSLDTAARAVRVETEVGPAEIHYERLVIALGAVARTLPIPGLAEHGLGFKSLADAIYLRNHVLRQLELAEAALTADDAKRHLSFVFVGAGYAGVEALAELSDLLRDTSRFYPGLKNVRQRWVLVDAAPKILPEIPARLGDYAARELWKRGVDIRVSTTLESVDEHAVTLSDGSRLDTETLVWTAGVKANPIQSKLGLPLDDRGRVVVNSLLQVEGFEDVWALGDGARVPNEATPGRFDPPTCQHALRQARRLAKNLSGSPRPYQYRMLGQVATLGRHKGIADVLGLRLRGFLGWFVTRTYHLYQLPLLTRKLRVVTDWTVSLFFRRDIAELGMLGHPTSLRDDE
jgi:NADH dehydrogenase